MLSHFSFLVDPRDSRVLKVISAFGTPGTREYSITSAVGTPGTHEYSIITAFGTPGTREYSVIQLLVSQGPASAQVISALGTPGTEPFNMTCTRESLTEYQLYDLCKHFSFQNCYLVRYLVSFATRSLFSASYVYDHARTDTHRTCFNHTTALSHKQDGELVHART